jgi:predicted secreted protein
MRSAIVLLLILSSGMLLYAQPPGILWSRTYGRDSSEACRDVVVLPDGSVILLGNTRSFGAGAVDCWLVKVDRNGDSLWSRTYGGPANDWGAGVSVTPDGGFILAGSSSSFGSGGNDFWLVRTDGDGDSLWSRAYGGVETETFGGLGVLADSGYFVAGYTQSFGAGTEDFWLLRVAANGDSLWSRTYGGPSNERCWAAIRGRNGNFYLVGDARSFGLGDKDVWLVAANANGDSLWSHVYGGARDEECRGIVQTADGGFLLAGSQDQDGAGNFDAWLIRTDSAGNVLWDTTFGGPLSEGVEDVTLLPDGGFAVLGNTLSFGAGDQDVWLLRVSADGDSLWSLTAGTADFERGWSLAVTSDHAYVIGGTTRPVGDTGDFYLVKTLPDPTLALGPFIVRPSSFVLSVFPNPFNPSTEIVYDLPAATHVSLRVFDLLGREVAVLKDGLVEPGSHRVTFDGGALPSGIYFARLDAGAFSEVRKLMLLK